MSVAVFLPILLVLKFQLPCFYTPFTETGCHVCSVLIAVVSPGVWRLALGGYGGHTLGWWEVAVSLCDSAVCLAIGVARA